MIVPTGRPRTKGRAAATRGEDRGEGKGDGEAGKDPRRRGLARRDPGDREPPEDPADHDEGRDPHEDPGDVIELEDGVHPVVDPAQVVLQVEELDEGDDGDPGKGKED